MLLKCLLGVSLISLFTLTPINTAENVEQISMSETEATCFKAALKEGISNPINEVYELKDLSGNTFYAQIGDEDGFMVFDPVAGNFIEKSSELASPYDFNENHDYYYFGPMNYYERMGDEFYSILDETYVDLEYVSALQNIFDEQLLTFRSAQSQSAYENYCEAASNTITPLSIDIDNKTYINNYQYIRDAIHPDNNNNSCGYVAGSMILYYWDRTMHEGTVRPQYLDADGNLNKTNAIDPEHNLKDKLVELAGAKLHLGVFL